MAETDNSTLIAPESTDCWVAVTEQGLEVSPQDDRAHRIVKLSNGLVACISSDPTHEKGGAALAVMVGASADPGDLPGVAHFCEHMCFLGSEKYPEENAYKKFLSAHGGRSNASTSSDRTVFQFDVTAEYLEEALDIFSQFFVAPLFTESATGRELEAVDSEDSKNRTNDGRRLLQVQRALADPKHTYAKFSTGNLKTLREDVPSGLDVREAVLAFHGQHYVASRMRLAVCGRATLDDLERWVRNGFSTVPAAQRPPTDPNSAAAMAVMAGAAEVITPVISPPYDAPFHPPFTEDNLPVFVEVAPLRELRELQLAWPMPSMRVKYRANPIRLFSHLLGHEGEGSVFAVLQDRGWATALSSSTGHEDDVFSLFTVKITMTPEGETHWPQIVALVQEYCNLLQGMGQSAIQHHWGEMKAISALSFRFQQKSHPYDFVQSTARSLTIRSSAHVFSGGYVFDDLDVEKVLPLCRRLTIQNLMLRIFSQSMTGKEFNSEERWYKVPFSRGPLPAIVTEVCAGSASGLLSLPSPNEFIPDDLTLCGTTKEPKLDSPVTPPSLLVADGRGRLWHKIDERYAQPRVDIVFLMRSKAVKDELVAAGLLMSYMKSRLKQSTYDAGLAGLSWSVSATSSGLVLSLNGYSQRAPRLFAHLLATLLKGPWAGEELDAQTLRFEALRERTERAYRNFDLERPDAHASYWCSMLLSPEAPLVSEKLHVIESLTMADLKSFHGNFLKGATFAECFVIGNMLPDDACNLYESAWARLCEYGITSLPAEENTAMPLSELCRGEHFKLCGRVPNAAEENSGIHVYFQVGELAPPQQAALRMVAQLMKEPCFNQLRTQQQIGYIVASSTEVDYAGSRKIEGLSITIVSKKLSATDVLARVDTFLVDFRALLAETTAEGWNQHTKAVITKLLIPPKKLAEEANRHWNHIFRKSLRWNWREELAEALRVITCEEALSFYDELVGSATRRRTSALIFGKAFPLVEEGQGSTDTAAAEVLSSTDGIHVPGSHFLEVRASLPQFDMLAHSMPGVLDMA